MQSRQIKQRFKAVLCRYVPERTLEELAVHTRVLLRTSIPNAVLPSRRRKIKSARTLCGIKLNIGCGSDRNEGWFGIDFISPLADLQYDVAYGLPFADRSCRLIFAEHVFEHFDRRTLRFVLQECLRILVPGGSIRLIVPNLRAYIDAYNQNDGRFSAAAYTTQGHLESYELMNDVFYVTTHRWIHDFDSMRSELRRAGFVDIEQMDQHITRCPEFSIDNPENHRRAASLYVEARRQNSS